ncbi:MAG: Uma2 family endonuclease [Anaerolineales bacterium]
MPASIPLTIEKYWAEYAGHPYELINGQAVRIPRKEYVHEVITSRVLMLLDVFVENQYLGSVLGNGARFALSPYELRAADAAYVSHARLQSLQDPESFLPFAPDLMVEVVSSRYTSQEIEHKAEIFLQAGSQIVWIIDPAPQLVTMLDLNGTAYTYADEDIIPMESLLPGLRIAAADFFPPLGTNLHHFH